MNDADGSYFMGTPQVLSARQADASWQERQVAKDDAEADIFQRDIVDHFTTNQPPKHQKAGEILAIPGVC
jgi:hypothetical protein